MIIISIAIMKKSLLNVKAFELYFSKFFNEKFVSLYKISKCLENYNPTVRYFTSLLKYIFLIKLYILRYIT